jgi:hypothetical protein
MGGTRAHRVDLRLESTGHTLAGATDPALQSDDVGGMADGAEALGESLALPGKALGLWASRFHRLLHLCQARTPRWGAARTMLCRLAMGGVVLLVPPFEPLVRFAGGLVRCSLRDGHRS